MAGSLFRKSEVLRSRVCPGHVTGLPSESRSLISDGQKSLHGGESLAERSKGWAAKFGSLQRFYDLSRQNVKGVAQTLVLRSRSSAGSLASGRLSLLQDYDAKTVANP